MLDDTVAEEDLVPHSLPAQVEVSVLQAERLVHGSVAFDLEGRGLGRIEDSQVCRLDLYRAGR
jgi:hypothetical protein